MLYVRMLLYVHMRVYVYDCSTATRQQPAAILLVRVYQQQWLYRL